MLTRLVAQIDTVKNVTELCRKLNVFDAVYWTDKAWSETSSETISKCFTLSGFSVADSPITDNICVGDQDDQQEDDDIPLAHLLRVSRAVLVDQETLVSFDQDIPTEDDDSDWEKTLVATHMENETNSDSDDEGDNDTTPCEADITMIDIVAFSKTFKKTTRE